MRGATRASRNSPAKSAALAANSGGTRRAGPIRESPRAMSTAPSSESADPAIIAFGKSVAANWLRKKASRVAFPATCCAMIAVAAIVAIVVRWRSEPRLVGFTRRLSDALHPFAEVDPHRGGRTLSDRGPMGRAREALAPLPPPGARHCLSPDAGVAARGKR